VLSHKVLFDIRHQVSCVVRNSHKEDVGDPRKKFLTKSIDTRLNLKRKLYRFQLKRGLAIDEHMNNYTKLLTNLVNVDVSIEEEEKVLILLNSLSDEEYKTFVLTLINNK